MPMQETWYLGGEVPLEEEMVTHSSILAWEIPRTEKPGGLQSTGSQRVGHDWMTKRQQLIQVRPWRAVRIPCSLSCGPKTSCLSSSWELVGNADFWPDESAPFWTGSQVCVIDLEAVLGNWGVAEPWGQVWSGPSPWREARGRLYPD